VVIEAIIVAIIAKIHAAVRRY